ncbi:MAG: hypothetical protein IJ583_14770 [Firmicutes bacterium]|nr:hypothetical protein [Bacillota bacterium]
MAKKENKKNKISLGKNIKKLRKKRRKADFFPAARMWFSTFLSIFKGDKGTIPGDIGDKIYIGENMYVTKNYMSAVIMIREFSLDTVLSMTSDMIKTVKFAVPETIIDFTFKNSKYEIDLREPGLKERVNKWQEQLDSDKVPPKIKERNAWLLYSYDVLKSGKLCYVTRCFITVRAKNNAVLQCALNQCEKYLNGYNIDHKVIKSDIKRYLNFISPVINKHDSSVKDLPSVISSAGSLSEILPVTQGLNDETGTFLGIDRNNENPYMIDLRATARAKNFYVLGPSGEGKTFLVITWLIDMFADGYSISITDIKGNEFTAFTLACGGKVVSMRPGSTSYVNTFKISQDGVSQGQPPEYYFKENVKLSKMILTIITGIDDQRSIKVSALMEEFLDALYLQIGVSANNTNTWKRTEELSPFKVYEYFKRYISEDIKRVYADILDDVLMAFNTYLEPSGSGSELFSSEYVIEELINTRVITFDYGLLDKNRITDPIALELKQLFAKLITDSFVRSNKDKKLHTVRILEESQMTTKLQKRMYAEEISLRRSQNQINIMLGNSIAALKNDEDSAIILDNINIWVLGRLTRSNMKYLIEEYSLEDYEEQMEDINKNSNLDRTFLVINKLHRNTTSAMLKAFVPNSVVKGSIFKVVDSSVDEGV